MSYQLTIDENYQTYILLTATWIWLTYRNWSLTYDKDTKTMKSAPRKGFMIYNTIEKKLYLHLAKEKENKMEKWWNRLSIVKFST